MRAADVGGKDADAPARCRHFSQYFVQRHPHSQPDVLQRRTRGIFCREWTTTNDDERTKFLQCKTGRRERDQRKVIYRQEPRNAHRSSVRYDAFTSAITSDRTRMPSRQKAGFAQAAALRLQRDRTRIGWVVQQHLLQMLAQQTRSRMEKMR